eukprot:TRINITY_DN9871_c0_g1_i1.p1 TRINITY_DN9871_c0_g1~~TRINITY_DN9871_c0_g1_i1.p1  ORF type:complete len:423 (+),score=120.17 TRINITY_DN9871_c0_g1_i1:195-1463(+)
MQVVCDNSSSEGVVVCLGAALVDFIAQVDSFPERDAKIRTTSSTMTTGGNALNALCLFHKFGLSSRLVSSFGRSDPLSKPIRDLCSDLQLDTSFVVDGATGFSYVIVDGSSRTIIHTPGYEMNESDVHKQALDNAHFLYLDGRHPDAAYTIAMWANSREIPVALDLERSRGSPEKFEGLLNSATIISMSENFVTSLLTDSGNIFYFFQSLLESSKTKFIITTLGEFGSLLFRKKKGRKEDTKVSSWSDLLLKTRKRIDLASWKKMALTSYEYEEEKTKEEGKKEEKEKAEAKDGGREEEVKEDKGNKEEIELNEFGKLEIIHCAAFPNSDVVDTTGAGDVFFASICVGYLREKRMEGKKEEGDNKVEKEERCDIAALGAREMINIEGILKMASYVASRKCSGRGVREGLENVVLEDMKDFFQ